MSRNVSFVYTPPDDTAFTDGALEGMIGQRAPIILEGRSFGFGKVVRVRRSEGDSFELTLEVDDDTANRLSAPGVLPLGRIDYDEV